MKIDELKEILEKHLHWIHEDCEGWQNMRANLYGADLYGANLRGANLYGADLYGADLRRADLYGANLYGADLREADLRRADLREADLYGANLYGADLREADLRGANLRGATLYGADLYGADLRRANLYGADLRRANLREADLREAEIEDKLIAKFFPICCPEYGEFIGWKKANGYIVKLRIADDAKRSSAFGRKCRCSKAFVIGIENPDGSDSELTEIKSSYDANFIYRVGDTVEVDNFDENRKNECAPGIHFFITRQEAVNYG